MQNVTVKNLKQLSKNNVVIYLTNGTKVLNSYGVNIAEINGQGETRLDVCYWDYSNTTAKGRCEFLNEKKPETEKKLKSGQYILTNLNE